MTGVVREAAANNGTVADATWNDAREAGWSDQHLADAYANLGATVFTASFLNYANTSLDL